MKKKIAVGALALAILSAISVTALAARSPPMRSDMMRGLQSVASGFRCH